MYRTKLDQITLPYPPCSIEPFKIYFESGKTLEKKNSGRQNQSRIDRELHKRHDCDSNMKEAKKHNGMGYQRVEVKALRVGDLEAKSLDEQGRQETKWTRSW